jgi:hypothetical protein
MPQVSGSEVTAYVSTKNRYFTTLPSCLLAIAMQTVKPAKIIIYDDGDKIDLRQISLYQNIFAMFTRNGIDWEVKFGEGKGQVLNHQKALEDCKSEWIWRLDDDNIAESKALEKMLEVITDDVVAVGGLVLHPTHFTSLNSLASSAIEDVDLGLNPQWYSFNGVLSVDHLYSTFIFRKSAAKHGYCMKLSPVGHNEETMFTYQMKRAGGTLLVTSGAVTWHLRSNEGGIRSYKDPSLWEHDKKIFIEQLKEWKVVPNKYRFAVLDSGMGDHYVFKKVLQKMKQIYKNEKIIVACCYQDIFKDDKVKTISIADAKTYFGNIDKFNIYKFMWDRNWNKSLELAFQEMYLPQQKAKRR